MAGVPSIDHDPASYDRPAVTVDLVLMSIVDRAPVVLLMRRPIEPDLGKWALPGGFVRIDESLDDAARRILRDKAHMADAYIEQLYTFGDLDRDPRARVITVTYFALLPPDRFGDALKSSPDLTLAEIIVPWADETGGPVEVTDDSGPVALAFDHAAILGLAMLRLRGKLNYSTIGFALLPETFTLRALQDVHEAILGATLNKPAFRRRMLEKGWIEPTGIRETGASFRPAELYRLRTDF
ncbi:NUDIX domain-containing protein [Sphingomonas oligophenolica]|uniref:NUDIX domain-containing protein n=1 Tax=Sphingomonas oligophenolica TaxID=301154 RepID=A0ABU9YCN7_9SPHN